MNRPAGWPLLAAVVGLLGVAATVFSTAAITNAVAALFIGSALTLLGTWAALIVRGDDPRKGDQ